MCSEQKEKERKGGTENKRTNKQPCPTTVSDSGELVVGAKEVECYEHHVSES